LHVFGRRPLRLCSAIVQRDEHSTILLSAIRRPTERDWSRRRGEARLYTRGLQLFFAAGHVLFIKNLADRIHNKYMNLYKNSVLSLQFLRFHFKLQIIIIIYLLIYCKKSILYLLVPQSITNRQQPALISR